MSNEQGFDSDVLANKALKQELNAPILVPGGTTQDQLTLLHDLSLNGIQLPQYPDTIFQRQITFENLPIDISWNSITPPNDISLASLEIDKSGLLKRYTLLKLDYVDGESETNTQTPRVLTKFDGSGNSYLRDIVASPTNALDVNYELRLFNVPKTVGFEQLTQDVQENNDRVLGYELNAYSPDNRWVLDRTTGIIVFYGDFVPNLNENNIFVIFTQYVGTTNSQPTMLETDTLTRDSLLYINENQQIDSVGLQYDRDTRNFNFGVNNPSDAYRVNIEGDLNIRGKIYTFGREFVGGGGGGGGDIPQSLLDLETYLTRPPTKFNDIATDKKYVKTGENSLAENELDAIGKRLDIDRGIDYDIENDGNRAIEWALRDINLPYVESIHVDIKDNTRNTEYIPFRVLSASAETFTLRLGDIVGNGENGENGEKFTLNPVHEYTIRVTPHNHINHQSDSTNPSIVDISLLNATQQTAFESYADLSLNWTTPYDGLYPGSDETMKQWVRNISSSSSASYRTIESAKKNIRVHEAGVDVSDVLYVNLGDNRSIERFIGAWQEQAKFDKSSDEKWKELNKLYTNVGSFGRSLDESPDNSGVSVRPFAAIWYDDRLSWAVDRVKGKMTRDISSEYVKFHDETSGDIRETIVKNGVWAGFPYKDRDEEFATETLGYSEAGHWSRNVLAGLDTAIEFNTFNLSDRSRFDASYRVMEDDSLGNVVEFVDVSNLDSWKIQDLSAVDLSHNTTVGRYALNLNYMSKHGRKKSIFYRDEITGEGLREVERKIGDVSVNRMIGMNEATTLPYYIGVIVEGRGVDGNLSDLSTNEQYLFAQRVFVDDLVGQPSLNTFITEYNLWRNMLYTNGDSETKRDTPLIAFCMGVPSLVSFESRLFSEFGNVCGTVLPYGGRVANYSILSAFTPREISEDDAKVKQNSMAYLEGKKSWDFDISTNTVNTTFDLVDSSGELIEWSRSTGYEIAFADTVMNNRIPMMKVDMYSLSYPDGVTDYGEFGIREDDIGVETGNVVENAFLWIHSDGRSFIGRLSKLVEDEITLTNIENDYPAFGGIGGIKYDGSMIEPVALARDLWKTTEGEYNGKDTWVLDHAFDHKGETISSDELLFYGGAFVNGNAKIQNGDFTRLNGEKTRYVHEDYKNPYDLVSHVYNQYIGNESDENASTFEKIFGSETDYLVNLRSDLSGVSDISGYKETGTRDILLESGTDIDANGQDIEYKWMTKQFATSTPPGNERKMIRLNSEFDPSKWAKDGLRVYTKQRAYYADGEGGIQYAETSWFAADSSGVVIESNSELFERGKYGDGAGNVLSGQFVYGTNSGIIPSGTEMNGEVIAERLRYGYSEIFVRVGIPVANTGTYKTMIWDLNVFDAIEIEHASSDVMRLLKTSVLNNAYQRDASMSVVVGEGGLKVNGDIISNQVKIQSNEFNTLYTKFETTPSLTVFDRVEIIAFKNVGEYSITLNEDAYYDILIVAGGGSGGSKNDTSVIGSGGGGAGGVIFLENTLVNKGTYDIKVGDGGASIADDYNNGENSKFGDNEAIGGGGGAVQNKNAGDGGSGGGGIKSSYHSDAPGTGKDGQGHDGATGEKYDAGGGGGAGGPGGNSSNSYIPGPGRDLSDTFGTDYGKEGVFAKGGRGSYTDGYLTKISGGDGAPNTGNGGGGGGGSWGNRAGSGGSGIVIIKPRGVIYEDSITITRGTPVIEKDSNDQKSEIEIPIQTITGEYEGSEIKVQLDVNGEIKADSLDQSSDLRLKNNISSLASQPDNVENFKLLRPVQYNLIERPDRSSMGLIAQEVEELFPELVSTDGRGFKSVNYTSFTALCINQIQKQEGELKSLRERLDKLEEK